MALSRTDLLGTISPSSGGNFGTGTYTSASFTPPSNSLLFVSVGFIENGNGTNPAVDFAITDSGGRTWTPLFRLNTTGGFATSNCVFYTTIGTASSMTVSFTCAGRNISWWSPHIYAFTGYDTTTPIGATASFISNSFGSASPTPASITLSSAPASTSMVMGFAAADKDGSGGMDPGSTFTEVYDTSNPTATAGGGVESEARTGSTSTTVDWQGLRPAGGNIFNWIVVGWEVREAAGGTAVNAPDAGGLGLALRSSGGVAVTGVLAANDAGRGLALRSAPESVVTGTLAAADAGLGLRLRSAEGPGVVTGVLVQDAGGLGIRLGMPSAAVLTGLVVSDTPGHLRWFSGQSSVSVGSLTPITVVDSPGWLRIGAPGAVVAIEQPSQLTPVLAYVRRVTVNASVDRAAIVAPVREVRA